MSKESQGNITLHRFLQDIQFQTQRKDEAKLLEYSLPEEVVTPIMMLYKKTKPMVHSPDGYIDIVAGILLEDTFAPYSYIICLDYILWTSTDLIKGNDFLLRKRQEADNFPQMINHFSQIHQAKQNLCSIAESEH